MLKASTDLLAKSKAFSFRARVSRDRQATNNQIVTYFNEDLVTVSRPDKAWVDIDGEHHDIRLYYDGKAITLFDPKTKLYASEPGPSTIDAMVQDAEKHGVFLPMGDLLRSDTYDNLMNSLQTAYVIGRVNIDNETYIHLVFTEPDADWQLWVKPGDEPVPRGMTVIYKTSRARPA